MNIVSEISRIKQDIANAYQACRDKGAVMPEKLTASYLAECILSLMGERIPYIGYKGTATALTQARRYITSTTTEDRVWFGGGVNGASSTSTGSVYVDTYDKDLVRTAAPNLSVGRRLLKAGSNSKYSIFAGGGKSSEVSTFVNIVDAYDRDMVKVTAPTLSTQRYMWNDTCTRAGDYILVAGGTNTSNKNVYTIDAFDTDLVLTTIDDEGYQIAPGGSLTFNNKAFFAGGGDATSTIVNTVAIYDEDLVRVNMLQLSAPRTGLFGVTNRELAFFAGGQNPGGSTASAIVDTFDKDYVAGTTSNLYTGRYRGGSASSEYYGVIAGGAYKPDEEYDSACAEAFTIDGVKIVLNNLSVQRRYLAGGFVNGNFLFAGGQKATSSSPQSVVNVYDLQ